MKRVKSVLLLAAAFIVFITAAAQRPMLKIQLNAKRGGNILALCDLPIRFGRAASDADVKAIRLIRLGVLSFFIHRLNQGNRYHGEQSEDQQILQNTFQKIAETKRARKHAPDQFHVFHSRSSLPCGSRYASGCCSHGKTEY